MEKQISEEVWKEIICHIKGHDNTKTDEFLRTLDKKRLLTEVHPLYQEYYTRLLYPPTPKVKS